MEGDATSAVGSPGGVDPVVADLIARVEALERENARLRSAPPEAGGEPAPGRRGLDRRHLLAGAAGAAAAGVAGALASSDPAAANGQGQSLTIGDANTATSTTGLTSSNSRDPALSVVSQGSGPAVLGTELTTLLAKVGGAVIGQADFDAGVGGQSSFDHGVEGYSGSAAGVYGQTQDVAGGTVPVAGVVGESNSFPGVVGVSSGTATAGVSGTNDETGGFGVRGFSTAGHGVTGTDAGSGVGVLGRTSPAGVAGRFESDGAQLLLTGTTSRPAPTGDATSHERGELICDDDGALWFCAAAGTPGTWRQLAGPSTAGTLHILPAPVRVYDSRPGTPPAAIGPKTPLVANTARVIDLTLNNSGVPAGASAALVTCSVVNVPDTLGNLTLWANGKARPFAATIVYGGSAGRFSTLALTALDAAGKCQVIATVGVDVAIDVVAYHR